MAQIENNSPENRNRTRMSNQNNQVYTGLILLLIGSVFLLRKMDITIVPDWVFGWEIVFIILGTVIGIKTNFKGVFWLALLLIGGVSLIDEMIPGMNIRRYSWPLILITLGLIMVLRPKFMFFGAPVSQGGDISNDIPDVTGNGEILDATAIFGSVKKNVVSKNFGGGEVVAVMGGAEINLSQADINGRVRLEVVNIMGGTKLIIPPTWDLHSEMAAIFGGVEDKRPIHQLQIDPKKLLVLEGTCIFGGLEIHSY